MSVFEWKKLNLFELLPCLNSEKNKLQYTKADIISYCFNTTYMVFCDKAGWVHILQKNWEKPITFCATTKPIQKCAISNHNNLLAILTQDDITYDVNLQIFDLNKIKKHKYEAKPISCATLNAYNFVSCLQVFVAEQVFMIAIGCQRGNLFLHRASYTRDISLNFRSYSVGTNSIIGIEFTKNNMFLCTDAAVFCYTLAENGIADKKTILNKNDDKTDSFECCTLQYGVAEPYFLVGRKNAVYCFTTDGRGPCYAVEGKKTCMVWYKNHLVLLKEDTTNLANTNTSSTSSVPSSMLIVIDIEYKVIALHTRVLNIAGILTDGTDCFIFTKNNELFALSELDFQTKNKLLLGKNLFDIALRFAQTQDCEEDDIAEINLKYGNHLMLKGNINLAVQKYIATIGKIDPYFIIRKLLDARYNSYLIQYLKALTQTKHAKNDHIALLMKCNEREHLTQNVDIYIKSGTIDGLPQYCVTQNNKEIGDRKIISDVSYSAFLATIDDVKLAYEFFVGMEEAKIYDFFAEHGNTLLAQHPQKTLLILKNLCSTTNSIKKPALISAPERFIPLLLESQVFCIDFLENLENQANNTDVYNFLFELHLHSWRARKKDAAEIVAFLKKHYTKMDETHVALLCKTYAFEPGLKYFCENSTHKNFNTKTLDATSFDLESSAGKNGFLSSLWLQEVNNKDFNLSASAKLINCMLSKMMLSGGGSFLEIVHNVAKNKQLTVTHIKDIFNQENVSDLAKNNDVIELINKIQTFNEILQNYSMNPIEFRSNVCNICKQEIFLPAIFYLCQHSFHKECLSSYTQRNECVLCASTEQQLAYPQTVSVPEEWQSPFENCLDVIKIMADLLAKGVMHNSFSLNSNEAEILTAALAPTEPTSTNVVLPVRKSTNPFGEPDEITISTNPFENCDDNLNPFESG